MIGKIRKLTSAQQETKVSHDWVVFRNPRNGKIRITACHECGAMLRGSANYRSCPGPEKRHPIISRGWKTNGEPVVVAIPSAEYQIASVA